MKIFLNLRSVLALCYSADGRIHRSMTKESIHEQVLDEQASLEALRSALDGAASPEEKLARVRRLVEVRLLALRAKVRREGEKPAQPTIHEGMPGATRTSTIHIVGTSRAMRQIEEAIHRVAHSNATVLIRGESGTGKELIARAIHAESLQADGAFIPLHCAAVADTLLESELFGHERGAFTGAHEQRKGKFELADGGTLFLDEIGDIPAATQVKLLRVLQEKCVERVGGSRSVPVNVRVISATHRDLEAMVAAGSFREDLYYRLNVVPIALPPLRQRDGDIPLLVEHFLAHFNRQNRRRIRLGDDLRLLMGRYHWPGNVRELQNCVERLVVMADPGREVVSLETVPVSLRVYFADMQQVTTAGVTRAVLPDGQRRMPFGTSLQDIERTRLVEALQRTGWNQAKTGRLLGLTPRQVGYKMRKYGIEESRDD